MSPCKHNENNFCTHYKTADPPENVCKQCPFYVKKVENKIKCRHIYDDKWCLRIVNGEQYWRSRGPGRCENCNWK